MASTLFHPYRLTAFSDAVLMKIKCYGIFHHSKNPPAFQVHFLCPVNAVSARPLCSPFSLSIHIMTELSYTYKENGNLSCVSKNMTNWLFLICSSSSEKFRPSLSYNDRTNTSLSHVLNSVVTKMNVEVKHIMWKLKDRNGLS